MPWRIEDGMKRIGANYVQAGLWRGFAAMDKCAASVRPDSVRSAMLADASNPQNCLSCRIGHRSKSSAKGRRTELSAEGRFGTKCGCCLVALTTAIK
jgi:hypothetical protein